MSAIVGRLIEIEQHPFAQNLEVLDVEVSDQPGVTPHYMRMVSGKHYRVGDMGIWFPPESVLPGWLARQLWLPVVDGVFNVRAIEIHGVWSPGIWAGEWYRNDSSRPSKLNSKARSQGADRESGGWLHWGPFRSEWVIGDDVLDQLTWPRSSTAEQPVANRSTQEGSQDLYGATPAVASIG